MIEADAYLNFVLGFAVLVGWFFFFFFESTFGLGLSGICLGLKLGFFLGLLCYKFFSFFQILY